MSHVSRLTPHLARLKSEHENCDRCRLPPLWGPCSGRVIICETSGRWAVALGRELRACCTLRAAGKLPEDFSVEQTRSVAECWGRLHDAPAAFVVVELTPGNVDTWLHRMAALECRYPLARVAVVVRCDRLDNQCLSRYQWLAREAGAVFVGTSLRSEGLVGKGLGGKGLGGVRELADVVRRHLLRSPQPQKSVWEEIWDKLPWSRM